MTLLQLGVNVFPPMRISSRLMAALTIDGAGTLHLEEQSRTDSNQVVYQLLIDNAEGWLLDVLSLHSEVGADVNYLDAAQMALGLLLNDPGSYPARVAEWADQHRTQLEAADKQLERWSDYHAQPDVRAFFGAYVEAALYSSTDNADDSGGEPLDANYTPADLTAEAADEMLTDCLDFLQDPDNALALAEAGELRKYSIEQAGGDFWLTRNGHGTGFWDRGLGEVGDRLTKAAKVYGSSDLYVGDDGKLYV